ncbi:MAG: hypothetical protein LBD41_04855 [Clostridiales Family XIII bacterium]|jgi:uncharacterized membrane protein YcgQ (UPF0703/DUF1980 family)|nr:hypothetical protein [Clostridiales Family XIII bacterium]
MKLKLKLMARKGIILFLIAILFLASCGSGSNEKAAKESAKNDYGTKSVDVNTNKKSSAEEMIVVGDRMFVTQMNDIYLNAADYIGKTIKYEGAFDIYELAKTGEKYYSVLRKGPGCCGNDANVGLEVIYDSKNSKKAYPKKNDWVECVGVLGEYEESGAKYLRLELSSLEVLPFRGQEYVKH